MNPTELIYPDSPHELIHSPRQAERAAERLRTQGLPTYSAARYIDLPAAEKRAARREFLAFRTGPYAERVAMLTEFDRIAGSLGGTFTDADAAAWTDTEPVDWSSDLLNL